MPRLTADQWETIRAEYEAGKSLNAVAVQHGVSRAAVQKRAKSEGWTQDVSTAIHRKVAEKVAGVVAGSHPKKKAEAIDAEAARRAAVIDEHREELESARVMARRAKDDHETVEDRVPCDIEDPEERQRVLMGLKRVAFEDLKAAKIHVETLKLIQEGERKAWGLDMPVNVSALTDEQLAALASGRMPT